MPIIYKNYKFVLNRIKPCEENILFSRLTSLHRNSIIHRLFHKIFYKTWEEQNVSTLAKIYQNWFDHTLINTKQTPEGRRAKLGRLEELHPFFIHFFLPSFIYNKRQHSVKATSFYCIVQQWYNRKHRESTRPTPQQKHKNLQIKRKGKKEEGYWFRVAKLKSVECTGWKTISTKYDNIALYVYV